MYNRNCCCCFFYKVTSLEDSNASAVLELVIDYKVCGQDVPYLLLYSQCLKYGRHLMDMFKELMLT